MLQLSVYAAPALSIEPVRRRRMIAGAGLILTDVLLVWLFHGSAEAYLTVLITVVSVLVGMSGLVEFLAVQQRLRRAEEDIEALAAANERLRIGRDLHDVLGHSLSAIALRADLARSQAEGLAPQATREMEQVAQLARQALAEVRAMVTGYRTSSIQEEWARLQGLLNRSGIIAEMRLEPVPTGPVERVLVLTLREAVTNILRHSQATHCRAELARSAAGWRLTVSDDGCGAVPAATSGSGLRGLTERAAETGGTLSWDTAPGRGFRLTAEIPLASGDHESLA